VIGVGATDAAGRLASYSSRGDFGDALQHPSLVAPGTNIISVRSAPTVTGISGIAGADAQRLSLTEMPYYTTATGTSFSAPQVAGAIALMLEANPNLTPADVKDILSRTATPMPRYFFHEAGAGMLNTYAAVLEAAFPERHMGGFRSTLSSNDIRFVTRTSQTFEQTVYPNVESSVNVAVPQNTIQLGVNIYWNLSANDFGLKVYDQSNSLRGESNYLNLPGFTGRREKVVLRNPLHQTHRASISHSGYVGTSQQVFGAVDVTQVEYPVMLDESTLSAEQVAQVEKSLLANLMLPEGRKFRPNDAVSRLELAEALVRAGLVPQYMASAAMFTDVRDTESRNAVESTQAFPCGGPLFYDATTGKRFYPLNGATKLAAAIAFVKAAGLSSQAAYASLPLTVSDASSIPLAWRGYVAVALQRGFISLDGNAFNPSRSLTRLELATSLNTLVSQ
jgi:serine protease AprX